MAIDLLSSPSEPFGSSRRDDSRLPPFVTADTPENPAPKLVLIDDAANTPKSRRRHRVPVFSLAAGDFSTESIKRAEPMDSVALKSDAAHLIEMGLHFFRNSKAYEAVSLYREALSHAPDSALGHYLLGIALKSLKQEEEARSAWVAAIETSEAGNEAQWARERAALLLSRPA